MGIHARLTYLALPVMFWSQRLQHVGLRNAVALDLAGPRAITVASCTHEDARSHVHEPTAATVIIHRF